MTVERGKIKPIWGAEYKKFRYVKQPIMDSELNKWRELGYKHDSFTGEMYSNKNPMPVWVNQVAFEIGLSNPGFTFYKMTTGDIMPIHVDHFNKYCKIFNKKRSEVRRAIVFLEDWKSGHYFEIAGQAITDYTAGEYVIWSCEEPHFAANIGTGDRYTLQITGT
jgi:hypothetical protein